MAQRPLLFISAVDNKDAANPTWKEEKTETEFNQYTLVQRKDFWAVKERQHRIVYDLNAADTMHLQMRVDFSCLDAKIFLKKYDSYEQQTLL